MSKSGTCSGEEVTTEKIKLPFKLNAEGNSRYYKEYKNKQITRRLFKKVFNLNKETMEPTFKPNRLVKFVRGKVTKRRTTSTEET